jgi:hypothetical protein
MAQHQNLPVGQQEKLLRQEPGFNDRRLARAENFERLSPVEQNQVRQSSRQLSVLPPDRQMIVRRAFQDLRGVPVDQRDTVLNSARYGNAFSPEERGILSNLLRVEPYDGPR